MYTYKIIEDENPLFSFITASGVKYVLELLKQDFDNIYFKDLYILSFYPVVNEGVKLSNDIKIKATISQIIIDFLDNNKDALIHYVCDSSDKRQYSRNRLFSKWFNESNTIDVYSKFNLNYPTEDLFYTLEFLFITNTYQIKELEKKVKQQMNSFSDFK
jgi:hypothetical protein